MRKLNYEKISNELNIFFEELATSMQDEYLEVVNYVENDLLKALEISNVSEWVTNPYSGKKRLLNPIQVALYDFIIGAEVILNMRYNQELNKKFSRAKIYFRNKWPNEYMTLLD